MGLVTKNTNLKSLKYGKDRPEGGNSNQPYITTPIPSSEDPRQGNDLSQKDFLLRGGIGAPIDTARDLKRLGKYFTDFKSINGGVSRRYIYNKGKRSDVFGRTSEKEKDKGPTGVVHSKATPVDVLIVLESSNVLE